MLAKSGLFYEPKSQAELFDYIDGLTGPGEKQIATVIFGMTWNLCAGIVEREMEARQHGAEEEEEE